MLKEKVNMRRNPILHKESLISFVVNNKTNCYRAFKLGIVAKGHNSLEGKKLVSKAREELGYSESTWSGDIYCTLWRYYKEIVINGNI